MVESSGPVSPDSYLAAASSRGGALEATTSALNNFAQLIERNQRSLASLPMASHKVGPSARPEERSSHEGSEQRDLAARLASPDGPQQPPLSQDATGRGENDGFVRQQLEKYVNLELVRDLIAKHSIELAIVLVILIYLVYYFSRISRRPKLIGNKRSEFVASIGGSFKQTLQSRFNPLIYFWGTNPQTALFGYLQGQTSNDEMPRSKFHRQYLYVSDAQYLASNIDLSQHYEKCTRRSQFNHKLCRNQKILEQDEDEQEQLPIQLSIAPKAGKQQQLSQNIQFVIGDQIEPVAAKASDRRRHNYHSDNDEDELAAAHSSETDENAETARLNRMLTRTTSADSSKSSAIGSSSDSGVFAHCESSSSNSSASSSSSGSSLTIDMVSAPRSGQSSSSSRSSSSVSSSKCSCSSLYENKLDELAMIQQQRSQPHHLVGDNKLTANQQRQFKREHFEFGQCALDWHLDSHEHYHKNKSVALISAGMTTGSDKKYVTDTVQTLDKMGYEVCVFIRRGVGGLKLNSAKFFSPSKWHDFEAAILSIKKQRPDCRLVAIGFSFGSIELCRYLSMSGERSLVASALLISCPFDPEAGGRNMRKRALNRKIDAYLAKNLGKQLYQALSFNNSTSDSSSENERTVIEVMEEGDSGLSDNKSSASSDTSEKQQGKPRTDIANKSLASAQLVHENYNGSVVDLSSLPKIKSLVDFEDNFNRVIQNYPNSDAYGADSRLTEQLAQIKTPTLCLSSEDDFMAPFKLLPIKQIEANENLCMILTKRGGHMAFIDGLIWPRKPYFAQRIIEEYMKLSFKANDDNNCASRTTK